MNKHHVKELVTCVIKFEKDFEKQEGGNDILDNIRKMIMHLQELAMIPDAVKSEFNDIDTKCLMYRDVCNKPDTPDSKRKDLFKDAALDFVAVCRVYKILDV